VFFVRERRGFASRADRAQALRACVDLKLDLVAEHRHIELAVLERRGDGDGETGERFAFGRHDGLEGLKRRAKPKSE